MGAKKRTTVERRADRLAKLQSAERALQVSFCVTVCCSACASCCSWPGGADSA